MCKVNGKVSDDSIYIEYCQAQMDEDPLQRWMHFLTFIESLEMIFSSIKKLVKYS